MHKPLSRLGILFTQAVDTSVSLLLPIVVVHSHCFIPGLAESETESSKKKQKKNKLQEVESFKRHSTPCNTKVPQVRGKQNEVKR